MSLLKGRHAETLAAERSTFASPWLANDLQGKYRSFSKAKNKKLISWGERIKSFVRAPGEVWFEDIDTVYVPMCWEDTHWVGLAIHLKMWVVEIFDSAPELNAERKICKQMGPVTEMLPYIIQKLCPEEASQLHGLAPFRWNRVKGIYENKRSGDCGPVAIKFMELHANGNPSETTSAITDKIVDDFRKQYAMDVYQELVVPLYNAI